MSHHKDAKRLARNNNNNNPPEQKSNSGAELKKTEFSLKVPAAKSVKLAADFTDWDKSPLEMAQAENGKWRVSVALPPGRHSYRFIVDGEWCDDPVCAQSVPNAFGTTNATINVA